MAETETRIGYRKQWHETRQIDWGDESLDIDTEKVPVPADVGIGKANNGLVRDVPVSVATEPTDYVPSYSSPIEVNIQYEEYEEHEDATDIQYQIFEALAPALLEEMYDRQFQVTPEDVERFVLSWLTWFPERLAALPNINVQKLKLADRQINGQVRTIAINTLRQSQQKMSRGEF